MKAPHVTTVDSLVAAAAEHVEPLDPDRFASEANLPNAVVVDVREAGERLDGSIAGAVHVPRGMLEFLADPRHPHHDDRLHAGRRILLYCASGDRSALGGAALQALGYTDVAHLAGGIRAWRRAGRSLVNEVRRPY